MREIYQRRSIRSFKSREVEKEKILEMIKAGMNGPRARGLRVASFVIIEDAKTIASINEVKHNYLPPIMIAVIGDPTISAYWEQDLGACMENMMLMATSLELGSCWLGVHLNETVETFVNDLLKIPKGKTTYALLSIGYPDEIKEENNYFDESVIHYNDYER